MYPRDARRSALRTRRVDVRALEKQLEELKNQIQETTDQSNAVDTLSEDNLRGQDTTELQYSDLLSPRAVESPSPTEPQFESTPRNPRSHTQLAPSVSILIDGEQVDSPMTAEWSRLQDPAAHDHEQSPDPSTAEGGIQVYGATSLLHDQSSRTPLANQAHPLGDQQELAAEILKAQLISNAALRRQEELKLIYDPSIGTNIDFDGVPMDLALHLLNLHWNRSHLSYLLTYRPAVMDSLFNNGPHINKLLLNAIYLQSSMYNDRPLPPELHGPTNKGLVFYERFKRLLPQYLDAPVLPTVVALLTCGACLVPYGKQSAGWALSGMAYQMIIDLGCHLEFPSYDGERNSTPTIIEQEMKKRVYWGAYVSDKFQSLFLGRPPMMNEETANVQCTYLDSFEEMEEWRPYHDPISQSIGDSTPAYYYRGTPSYAISTFQSLLRLCKIAARIVKIFYSANSTRISETILLQTRDSILVQLDQWHKTLSPWLRFDPTAESILAPHQLTPQ
ncbi:hypothetical protein N7456_010170 [Penicillium angulare]|uniref:Xylanolytic transcriptional activator regulatory domain-containing protein n=1 Tax=Penicillium angulare TaxID=116970 RepID=A0A9W9F6A9_9EURO|nr:hypothetical protein N7456_010170 [Penicillium angulare]